MIEKIKRDHIADYLVSTCQLILPIKDNLGRVFSFETIAIYRGMEDEGFSLCARCSNKEEALKHHAEFIREIFKRLNQ